MFEKRMPLKFDSASSRRQTKSSPRKENIKITEIHTYVPLSHDYVDLFANLVASLELCSVATELWEVWRDKLRDSNSKYLVQRVIVILSRYLAYPEGRAFSLHQHKQKREFLEIAEKSVALR